jgi:methylenetetrahydrofolate reductase (NADPH)
VPWLTLPGTDLDNSGGRRARPLVRSAMHDSADRPAQQATFALLGNFSLEITAKHAQELRDAAIPSGTRANIAFLGSEDARQRVEAARLTRELGLRPVPHVSARRLRSRDELAEFLAALAEVGASDEIFVVAGDPAEPEGPFDDALSVIRSGALADHGVRRVGVAGYPGGHPKIDDEVLWKVIREKWTALREQNLECSVISQFGFDTAPVVDWIGKLRSRGVTCPVRVGVPGPAGAGRLLRYARQLGVQSSASVVQKYGFSLAGLLRTAGPGRFIEGLAQELDTDRHGMVALHFYTFGGVRATAEWIKNARLG